MIQLGINGKHILFQRLWRNILQFQRLDCIEMCIRDSPVLGVDMSSTGEVGCIGDDFHEALLNSMIAVGFKIPTKSVMFSSGATKSLSLIHI